MWQRILLLGALMLTACFVGVFWLPAAEEPGVENAPPQTFAQLRERIERLETRVQQLERSCLLKGEPGIVIRDLRSATPPAPLAYVPFRPLPEGWQREEINGVPYYIVPLKGSAEAGPVRKMIPATKP